MTPPFVFLLISSPPPATTSASSVTPPPLPIGFTDAPLFLKPFAGLSLLRFWYDELWMPLLSDLTGGQNEHPPMILPPFDIEWIWYCHTLNPVHYRNYCETRFSKVIGKALIFDEENEEYAVNICRDIWRKTYPNEPFENEIDDSEISVTCDRQGGNDLEDFLMEETTKFKDLYERFFLAPYMGEIVYLIAAKRRYKKMLQLLAQLSIDVSDGGGCSVFVPTVDILLMWLTHQSYPTVYAADIKHMEDELMMKVVGPWDHSVKEGDIRETTKLWETTFDQPYEKAGGRVAVGFAVKTPVYWVVSDSDANTKYKSLHPRFLLEVSVYAMLRSQTDATIGEKVRAFLRLRLYRCHKRLKLDKPVSKFSSDTWQNLWHFYCEFGTKGIKIELRHPSSSLCFSGTGLLDSVPFMWNDLLRAPSLAFVSEVNQKIRVFTSITPPVQAPYLLKCVPDRVTDDSGAMISDVMLKLNQYRPQEGRWLSRTVLDHAGRECFVVRIRVGGGIWRRGGESPQMVQWEDRIIEVREGPWSYVAGSTIGKAPDKVVGTAKPKEESSYDKSVSWCFSNGDELTIQCETLASMSTLCFTLKTQDSNSSVGLLRGRKMQYEVSKDEKTEQGVEEEENEFVTVVRYSDENPNGKATALINWKLLAVEVLPEEDAVFVLLLCLAILRSVSEMRKEDIGGLLIRRRLKEPKLGESDWGSVLLDTASSPTSSSPSAHLQPWYRNAKAILAHDQSAEQTSTQTSLLFSLADGGDKLYKRGIIS
ncbi:hypothetical protein RND81_04G208800 [Saponaria officinalis]|uniref:GRPD C-terminal domain-containing protein n=1 Tax=Saponaria officinalis TaxID=3572 RepID=A0AAW1LN19_SAPOF